ncbi:hypothetical protein EB118_02200 [bacterium]|nr:hypothetical protein [bacterium]NDC93923.1 hypothetical protein [bacterium]NDD83244.1 hypothetical protein [bacterium]NDG28900.1 hypothetical protein [bacterium]
MTGSIVVNFIGAPSVGKSLMAALTFAELKHKHKSAELIQEFAKTLVWQGRFEELNNQWYVSNSQYKMLKAVDSKVDYICTDSALILGLLYNRYHKDNVSDIAKTERMILDKMDEFRNIYILLERGDFPYETIGRIHTEEESNEIQERLKMLLDEFSIRYFKVKSSKDSLEQIIQYIETAGLEIL